MLMAKCAKIEYECFYIDLTGANAANILLLPFLKGKRRRRRAAHSRFLKGFDAMGWWDEGFSEKMVISYKI